MVIVTVAGVGPRFGTVTEHVDVDGQRVEADCCPKYAVILPFELRNPEPETVSA